MSELLLETGLTNALIATLIAAIVWLCTRLIKNPYIASLLWLGVLVKLITPPLISLSIPQPEVVTDLNPFVEELTHFEEPTPMASTTSHLPAATTTAVVEEQVEEPTVPQTSFTPPTIETPLSEEVSQFEPQEANLFSADNETVAPVTPEQIEEIEQLIAKANSNNQPKESFPDEFTVEDFSAQQLTEPVSEHPDPNPQTELTDSPNTLSVTAASTSNTKTTSWFTLIFNFIASPKLWLSLWLTTTMGWFSVIVYRGYAFGKLVRQSLETSDELQQLTNELSARLELARPPHIKIVDAAISPMIWPFGRRSTILFPRHFLNALPTEKQSLVIAHELAHLKRHDHQFRWLELIVLSLYWWLPTVRFIRRELHIAQEKCCDAWVVHLFPDQTVNYSETLLTAAQMLSKPVTSPILATEFGRQNSLRQRIETMLKEGRFSPLSRKKLYGCLLLVGTVLLFSLKWTQANPEPDSQVVFTSDTSVETSSGFEETVRPEANRETEAVAFEEPTESAVFEDTVPSSESTDPFADLSSQTENKSLEVDPAEFEPTAPQPSSKSFPTLPKNNDPFGAVSSKTPTQSNPFGDINPFGEPLEATVRAANSPLTNPEMQKIVNPLMELLKSKEPTERQQAIEILGPYMEKLRKADKQSEYAKRTWETYQLAYLNSLDSAGRKQVLPQLQKTEPDFFLQYFVNSLLSKGIENRLEILEFHQRDLVYVTGRGTNLDSRVQGTVSTYKTLTPTLVPYKLPYTPQQLRQAVQKYSSLIPTTHHTDQADDTFKFTGTIKWNPDSPIFNETILKNYIANIAQLDKQRADAPNGFTIEREEEEFPTEEIVAHAKSRNSEIQEQKKQLTNARNMLERYFIQILQATPLLQNSVVTMAAKTTESLEETPEEDLNVYPKLLSSCKNLSRQQMPQLQKLLKSRSPELQKAAITALQAMLLPPEQIKPNDGKILSFEVGFARSSSPQTVSRRGSRSPQKHPVNESQAMLDEFVQTGKVSGAQQTDSALTVPQQNLQTDNENSKSAKVKTTDQPQVSREIQVAPQPQSVPAATTNNSIPQMSSKPIVLQNKPTDELTEPPNTDFDVPTNANQTLPKPTPPPAAALSDPNPVEKLSIREIDIMMKQQRKKEADAAAKQRDELIASLRELLDDSDPAVQQEARKQLAKIDPTYVLTLVDQILAAEGDEQYYQLGNLLLLPYPGDTRHYIPRNAIYRIDCLPIALNNLSSKEKQKQFLDLLIRFHYKKDWTKEQIQNFTHGKDLFTNSNSSMALRAGSRGGRGRSREVNENSSLTGANLYQPNSAITKIIVHCISVSIHNSKQTLPNLLELAEGEANKKIEESPNTQFLINWLRKDPLDNSDNSPTPYAYIGHHLATIKKGLQSKNAKVRFAIVTAIGNYLNPPKPISLNSNNF